MNGYILYKLDFGNTGLLLFRRETRYRVKDGLRKLTNLPTGKERDDRDTLGTLVKLDTLVKPCWQDRE